MSKSTPAKAPEKEKEQWIATAAGGTIHRQQAALALRILAAKGTAEMVESAVSVCADIVDEADVMGKTALHEAAGAGNAATVKALLRMGANPNALDRHLRTPCAGAAALALANAETIRAGLSLAEAMAPDEDLMDGKREIERLTLVVAAQCGRLDVVKLLLPKAANTLKGDSLKIRKAAAKAAGKAGWPDCERWITGWLAAEADRIGLEKALSRPGARAAAGAATAIDGAAGKNTEKRRPKSL